MATLGTALLSFAAAGTRAAVITDNFNDNDYTANPPWTVNHGSWAVDGGVLEHTPDANYRVDNIQLGGFSETVPYGIEVDAGTESDPGWSAIGLTFRVQDADNMYAAYVFPGYAGADKLYFTKFEAGVPTYLASRNLSGIPPIGPGEYSHFSVDVSGTNYTVSFTNGSISFSETFSDSTFASGGGAGLIHWARSTSGVGFYDNVVLTEVPEPATAALSLSSAAILLATRRRSR
jgi:hypothetical protein